MKLTESAIAKLRLRRERGNNHLRFGSQRSLFSAKGQRLENMDLPIQARLTAPANHPREISGAASDPGAKDCSQIPCRGETR